MELIWRTPKKWLVLSQMNCVLSAFSPSRFDDIQSLTASMTRIARAANTAAYVDLHKSWNCMGVVGIEMDSKTERFHKFLDICCVQDVQDWALYWSMGNSKSQLSTPWDRTTVMNRLCTTDDEGLHPVELERRTVRTRYSARNGQPVQQDRMIHSVKRGTNVEQGNKRNLPFVSCGENIGQYPE